MVTLLGYTPLKIMEAGINTCWDKQCTDDINLEKISDTCLIVQVEWFPGADVSGCNIKLKDSLGNEIGNSALYMSY